MHATRQAGTERRRKVLLLAVRTGSLPSAFTSTQWRRIDRLLILFMATLTLLSDLKRYIIYLFINQPRGGCTREPTRACTYRWLVGSRVRKNQFGHTILIVSIQNSYCTYCSSKYNIAILSNSLVATAILNIVSIVRPEGNTTSPRSFIHSCSE